MDHCVNTLASKFGPLTFFFFDAKLKAAGGAGGQKFYTGERAQAMRSVFGAQTSCYQRVVYIVANCAAVLAALLDAQQGPQGPR